MTAFSLSQEVLGRLDDGAHEDDDTHEIEVRADVGPIVREVGRQPWVVYGLMRTENAASNVSAGAISGSMVMFACFYVILISSFFIFARKWMRTGPDLTLVPPAEPVRASQAHATVDY